MKERKRERKRVYAPVGGPSLTKQAARDECDINIILKKGADTGLVAHLNAAQKAYMDLSESTDYKTSVDAVNAARDAFLALPAHIRQEFDNDPAKLLAFAEEPVNIDRLVELGLAEKPEEKAIPDALGKNAKKASGPEPETDPAQKPT